MSSIILPEIRNDDVLQVFASTTYRERKFLRGTTLLEAFLKADKVFEKYNYPCTLAVLSEGLHQLEWVNHIQNNKHRYRIELHGREHRNYKFMSRDEGLKALSEAKDAIEATFELGGLTTWYPPFGRRGTPEWGHDVCKELGIEMFTQNGKVDAHFWLKKPDVYPHVNFHFWVPYQVDNVEKILCRLRTEGLL